MQVSSNPSGEMVMRVLGLLCKRNDHRVVVQAKGDSKGFTDTYLQVHMSD